MPNNKNGDDAQMNDEQATTPKAQTARVVSAGKYRDGVLMGRVEIHAYTKHGSTSMLAVMPPDHLEAGETLVTEAWILGSRNFVVVGEHSKPMKIVGTWYDVKATKKI